MAVEVILVKGVTEILNKLLPVISQQINQAWGVKDDLRKLGNTLESIQALILDAEEKQINDATVRLWLRKLKDVVYDVDDVVDEFCYETMRLSERGNQLKHKLCDFIGKSSNPFVFHCKMAGKIRALKKRLDEIYNDQVRYTLNSTCGTLKVDDQTREQRNRLTTSVCEDSVLVGREDAISDLAKMLTNKSFTTVSPSTSSSHNSSLPEQIGVVSIVGMGGLGKTSLARLVYQDKSIETYFEQKMWVCVSDKFDVYKILKEIIESIISNSCGDPSNVDVLARQVKEKLTGKRYLLVLDDLWNEDAGDWEILKVVLANGVEGSKLLVSTRSQKVASVVGGKVYNLQKLTADDCWSIMQKKCSFRLSPNMVTIGQDIAKKCDGLPLAANFLGSLLCLKREESNWVSINTDKNLWVQPENKKVISILKLSYDNLASPLKQCFSYCCLFPKDWEIEREILVRLWTAEGFLQSNEVNNKSFEDTGNDYFDFLLWNSFFQDTKKDQFGAIRKCKMHDLVHDLAVTVADRKDFGISGKEYFSQVRRVQCESSSTIAEVLSKAKNLRTILVLRPTDSEIGNFSSAKRLRVLYLLGLWNSKFSFSVWKFKHLRFLDVSHHKFDLSHDVTLNHHHNLQTLALRYCKNVSGFLGGIRHLKNLRHLDVSYSDIEVLLDDFIVNLTNLQTLNLSGCSGFKALPENIGLLKHLNYLNLYSLPIRKLPDSISCISNLMTLNFCFCRKLDALPSELGNLTRLRYLDLSYTNIKELPESCTSKLCNLEIVDFASNCELPKEIKNWPILREFRHLRYKDTMPRGMEKLTCLETLTSYVVSKKEDIQVRGSDQSGIEQLAALDSLQVLHIRSLENVRGGIQGAGLANMKNKQNLRELYLSYRDDEDVECDGENDDPMVLEGLLPHPILKKLHINGFSGLKLPNWMGSNSLLLVSLSLRSCNICASLPALGMLPCLRDLSISKMKSVKYLGKEFYYQQQEGEEEYSGTTQNSTTKLSLFPSLITLSMFSTENLEEWISPPLSYFYVDSFPLLERLHLHESPKLRRAPNSFPSLKDLELNNTKAVNSILSVSSGGGCLTSLTSISIWHSPEMIWFPLGVLLENYTPNLRSLEIRYCNEFQGFVHDNDDDLNSGNSSLNKLVLNRCPVLTSLPDLRLWTSLRELFICKCDTLKEHIPYDLKTSLSFLKSLKVDFIQRQDQQLKDPTDSAISLINLMKK